MENNPKNNILPQNPADWFFSVFYSLILIVIVIAIVKVEKSKSYQDGKKDALVTGYTFEEGKKVGYSLALDTVESIMKETAASQTKVSKIIIASKDTNTYYLSNDLANKPTKPKTFKQDERIW